MKKLRQFDEHGMIVKIEEITTEDIFNWSCDRNYGIFLVSQDLKL